MSTWWGVGDSRSCQKAKNDAWWRSWPQLIRHGWTTQPIVSWQYSVFTTCVDTLGSMSSICLITFHVAFADENGHSENQVYYFFLFFPPGFVLIKPFLNRKQPFTWSLGLSTEYFRRGDMKSIDTKGLEGWQGRKHWGRCAWIVNA